MKIVIAWIFKIIFKDLCQKNNSPQGYDYCAPYGYQSSFINGAIYPKLYSFDEYQSELRNAENLETINFLSKYDVKHISELSQEQKDLLNQTLFDSKKKR